MNKWFPIHTSRLLLRLFSENDESDVHEYGSDAIVSQYADWGPNTAAQTHDRIQGYLKEQMMWPRDEVHLAAELHTARKVIGTIRLKVQNEQTRAADLGFVIPSPVLKPGLRYGSHKCRFARCVHNTRAPSRMGDLRHTQCRLVASYGESRDAARGRVSSGHFSEGTVA